MPPVKRDSESMDPGIRRDDPLKNHA